MPCRDGGPEPTVYQEDYDKVRSELKVAKKRLDLATRVACELEKAVGDDNLRQLTEETQEWVEEHREADEKRRREEEDRARRDREEVARRIKHAKDTKAALSKLTHEEREILGLPDPA